MRTQSPADLPSLSAGCGGEPGASIPMSSEQVIDSNNRWLFSFPKLTGWLAGLFTALFGGLLYISPGATYLGVSHTIVLFGIMISMSYSIAMSSSRVSRWVILLLSAGSLALICLGRTHAPVIQVLEAIKTGEEQLNKPGVLASFALPIMLLGMQVLQLVVPWLRDDQRMGWLRGTLSLVLILGGGIALAVGSVLTARTRAIEAQPYMLWIAVPLAFLLGTGLRVRWKGWVWIVLSLLVAATLPATWYLLRNTSN